MRWQSKPIVASALPAHLYWREEKSNPDYRVNLAFCVDVGGRSFRRLTFPDGTHMFDELIYEGVK